MISVIIPVYNTEAYIDRCLSSVVSQSVNDLEIIVIDDCSTDGSREKIEAWTQRDARISAIYKDHNCGVSDSRNNGLLRAKGEYITFVDSDDYLEPEDFRSLLNHLEQTQADIAFGRFQRITADGIETNNTKVHSGSVLDSVRALEYCLPAMGKSWFDGYIWDKLYRKNVLIKDDSLILFDESIRYAEDCLWLVNVLVNISKAVIVNEAVYSYDCSRNHSAHISVHDNGNAELAKDAVNAYENIFSLVKDQDPLIADNVLQRSIIYRKLACRAAADKGNRELFDEMKEGYISTISVWLKRHHTFSDLMWSAKQTAVFCYAGLMVRFIKSADKEDGANRRNR